MAWISGRDEFTTVCRLVSGPSHAAQGGLHCTVENTGMQSLGCDEDGQGIYSSLQSNLFVHFYVHYIRVDENILIDRSTCIHGYTRTTPIALTT